MPRDGGPARLRLQQAALELYEEHGFDRVTIAEIAARAEVTERTFYRHFADKREVLFDGERVLREKLTSGVRGAPQGLSALSVLLWSFRSTLPYLEGNRHLSEPLRRIIAANPGLRERQQAKTAMLIEALGTALQERGVPGSTASLAARVGMAAFAQAASVWFAHPEQDVSKLLGETFAELRELTAALGADQQVL
ncbi:MAG TPA: helix-turn-helix domain-containing protein [Actinospica sp.]|nr:helix-turn-helix domain-containing protein [Actinospica sp.]